MQLSVTGKQIDIGSSLRSYVQNRLTQAVGKYFDRPVDGSVTFSRDGHEYRADCTVHLASGLHLQSQARSTDIYASFDGAAERMEKRLRRYKSRIRDHHNGASRAFDASPAREHVIAAPEHDETTIEPATLNPVVVSESAMQLRTLTVGEAVMQLDLMEAPALVFRNSAHGEINVVYRRADGNIGWVDAHTAKVNS
jgi:ribosomal subunit interface protein